MIGWTLNIDRAENAKKMDYMYLELRGKRLRYAIGSAYNKIMEEAYLIMLGRENKLS